jgi:hypothetical protein
MRNSGTEEKFWDPLAYRRIGMVLKQALMELSPS